VPNLHIVAGNPTLNIVQIHLMGDAGMQFKLRRKLEGNGYDYVFIDTPPSLGMLTINALTASQEVLVPLSPHYLSSDGVNRLLHAVKSLRKEINPKLSVRGFVITMSTGKNPFSLGIEKKFRTRFGSKVFSTTIPYNPHLTDAPAAHRPIIMHAEGSEGTAAYMKLAEEFLAK
jgi:chromosome partitioning protein